MSKHPIERMADEANEYLAKKSPGSYEQMNAKKTLGLLIWFMSEFAYQRAAEEAASVTLARLWESVMVHADQYLRAQTQEALNAVLMVMSNYKAPCD